MIPKKAVIYIAIDMGDRDYLYTKQRHAKFLVERNMEDVLRSMEVEIKKLFSEVKVDLKKGKSLKKDRAAENRASTNSRKIWR